MNCDWCGRKVRAVVPVLLSRDTSIDGEPHHVDIEYGQACQRCVDADFTRFPIQRQLREHHERRIRVENWAAERGLR